MPVRSSALLCGVLLLSGVLCAQLIPPNHRLIVNVVLNTTGRPVNSSIKVELLDMSGTPMAEAFTNHESGTAEFRGAYYEGTYRLKVTGPDIEAATVEFQINPIESEHREYVKVMPLQQQTDHVPAAGNQNVSVQSMEVPAPAREKFDEAMASYSKGDVDKAKQLFQESIRLYPQYARAHNNLGVLYLRANDKVSAREEFSQAIKNDSGLASAYVNLAKVDFAENKLDDAERVLDQAITIDRTAISPLVLLSSVEFMAKQYDKALATIARIHTMPQHEQFGDVHMVAGEIYLEKKQPDKAIGEYETFLKELPNDPRAPKVKDLVARLKAARPGATAVKR